MKSLSTLILLFLCSCIYGQQVITWNGGTPGKQREWNEARNWIPNRVPDEFSHVVIRELNNGHGAMPEIDKPVFISSLEVLDNARLEILNSGSLTFDGMHFLEGAVTLDAQKVSGDGKVYLTNFNAQLETENTHTIVRNKVSKF